MSKRPTRKEIARTSGISERSLYMAVRLKRLGRPDLEQAVERGEMKLYRALQLAEGREPLTAFDKLITTWNRCTDEDRFRFLVAIGVLDDSGDQCSANLQSERSAES
jgi:hypothetical protein